MLVLSVQIDKFRNFTNKQTMTVDPAVTCLIGKNESGKTTVLKALHRLNPANNPDTFNLTRDYPRRHLARDKRAHDLLELAPVTATFVLEEGDLDVLEDQWGVRPPADARIEAARTYDDELEVRIVCDLHRILELVFDEVGIDEQDDRAHLTEGRASTADVVAAAKARSKELKEEKKTARAKVIDKVPTELQKYELLLDGELDDEQHQALVDLLPKFFYFSTYELLPGECDLHELAARDKSGTRRRGDATMLALLRLAGEGPADFLDEDYDSRKAELQAASLELSEQVFEYWKQNDALTVVFDTDLVPTPPDPSTGEAQPHHRILKIELRDERHGVETNFSTRSTGFQWFFSFLAAFSVYRDRKERVVVLLDEPGTSLHGEAQGDFLRYIYGEIGTKQQVLYTTHSQHMIDPTRYETMRAIHDQATRQDPTLGVVITPVSLSADPKTILPVEAALGYSVAQHLFLGSGPLLAVEGSSDFVFLLRVSDYLISKGRTGLDPRAAIIPVGGVGNMPAFIAVMGRRLTVRAIIDGAETTKVTSKVISAAEAAGVDPSAIIVIGQLGGLPDTADIEDLFTTEDYLWLYNKATGSNLAETDLITTEKPTPILMRLKIAREKQSKPGTFDHVGPAHELTRERDEFFEQVDDQTLNQFEAVFKKLQAAS
ncbi:putative ATP-dependent endonuclease of OLD family [Kitasatospora sp. GAS204A]|uniref:AAA family ATPase n=1 Tax=unclassified Kitasatospora TaxID=2633591 RepID=UPI0024738038|nr:AAA family ATPase [Kitasatospora sp. GAS204B]MDH6119358.1 putative ATP-dependent endonuclease of OLD family [Kitasatospora sp. GAS204B]